MIPVPRGGAANLKLQMRGAGGGKRYWNWDLGGWDLGGWKPPCRLGRRRYEPMSIQDIS
jgi:hypothetical protein